MAPSDFDAALHSLQTQNRDPEAVNKAITTLGTSSSTSANSRERLADPDTLQTLLNILDTSLTNPDHPPSTSLEALRCIGNAAINNDSARQVISDHGFGWTGPIFSPERDDVKLKTVAFNCLYNICCDFEPAQRRCCRQGVWEDVLGWYFEHFVKGEEGAVGGHERVTSMFCDFLLWVCSKREEGDELRKGDESRRRLVELPHILRERDTGVEDFATAVEVALTSVRDAKEQERIIKKKMLEKVWIVLEDVEGYVTTAEQDGEEEDVKLLVPMSTSLTWCLSDMATSKDFTDPHAFQPTLFGGRVFSAIKQCAPSAASASKGDLRLASTACQVLGNMLWSAKEAMQSNHDISAVYTELHDALLTLLGTVKDVEVLHSGTGMLIQMCRHADEYRANLAGDARLEPALEGMCESESKEVRQGGMKLLQLLGKEDEGVRERFAGLARRFLESLVVDEQAAIHHHHQQQQQQQQGGSIVEVPD